ncbi:uncharacterized protein MONOS_18378 [Monocercomonoides exilis]|uniref:uncharacterized protein n=1 Tax=Monocercomonoides exilis TaxID=2049356 RepID=UPI003559893C|nr:hypothetical protein MONOS_18378 [Monocercomonoides exilis]
MQHKFKYQDIDISEKFSRLIHELEDRGEKEQIQKIEEIDRLMEGMDKEKLDSAFKEQLFSRMDKMIEEKKMSLENTIALLKHMGYWKVLNYSISYDFIYSSLGKRFERLIVEEEKKKEEERNEKFLVDLCECCMMLCDGYVSEELLSICMSCVLQVALRKKEKNEETQKEVEMALLGLSDIRKHYA